MGVCLDIFSLICHFSFLSPFLWETAGYRLKYCPTGPLNPNTKKSNDFFEQSVMPEGLQSTTVILTFKTTKIKIFELCNSVDPDEAAH